VSSENSFERTPKIQKEQKTGTNTKNFNKMKKKVKKSQGKRTRGATKRQQIPTQEPSPAPPWRRPWILTSTDEYDERTVSAEMYAEREARGNWHRLTQRTEEEEQHYQMLFQQEYYELGARDRERAAAYAEAERHQQLKAQEEADRRDFIAAKAATKKAKGAAKAAANAAAAKAAAAESEAAKFAEAKRSERNRVAATAAAAGAQRQRQRAQHGKAAHAAADAARHRAGRRVQHDIASRAAAETARERAELEETIEEMVCRMEREMEEGLETLLPSAAATPAPTAAQPEGVPTQRVPAAAETELEILELENKQFTNSYVEPKPKPPPDPTTNASAWDGVDKVEGQPWRQQQKATNNKMAGAAVPSERKVPGEKKQQSPPQIEPARRPPPDRDRYRSKYKLKGCGVRQLKGCRRGRSYQKVSAKGVLDIGYLCPRPRVRGRIPIHVWCPPTGTQRTRRHGGSVFGRPAQ
jgi:hypothetical protein